MAKLIVTSEDRKVFTTIELREWNLAKPVAQKALIQEIISAVKTVDLYEKNKE
jgi:hypothetical protein